MEQISLRYTLPRVFIDMARPSDLWNCPLELSRGDSSLVEAESGAGKSSLCSFLYGYRGDYLGEIFFDDRNIRDISTSEWQDIRTHQLSILWQDLRLFADLTARENILIKNRLTDYRTMQEIEAMCQQVGIDSHLDRPARLMSLGQQQRVAIVRALCQPFDFILLDEPVSHLDQANAMSVGELITHEAQKQSAGILATSVGHHLPLNYTHRLVL